MGKSKKDKTSKELNDLEQLVYEALLLKGWVIPQTIEEVLRVQEEFPDNAEELPDALEDPYAVLKRSGHPVRMISALSTAEEESQEEIMSRAARCGGEITPEIGERMRQDREAAEREDADDPKGS